MEELFLTIGQALVLVGGLVLVLVLLLRKPINTEVKLPKEKTAERDLHYLQIQTYYGG